MTQRRIQAVRERKTYSSPREEHILRSRRSHRILPLLLLSVLTIHAWTSIASAQVATQPSSTAAEGEKLLPPPKDASPSDSYGAWGRLLLAMAIVVGLIVALGWLVKRLGGGKGLGGAGALKLVARANLSPKHQMFLVRMGSRLVLIGAGPQGLATLSEITDAEEAAQLLQTTGLKEQKTEGGKA